MAEFAASTIRKSYPSRCTQCGGKVQPGMTDLVYLDEQGEFSVIHQVPAGICQACGEKYLRPETAEAIERLMSSPPLRQETVKAWDFAASA